MTKIYIAEIGPNVLFECTGHSGYGEKGKDIVCAAVSILSQTFALLCMELEQERKIQVNEAYIGSGRIRISIKDSDGCTMYPVKMLKTGFSRLCEEYPENVSFTTEKWES
jgi:uncharacterized protein YsxB (DUF464 family)